MDMIKASFMAMYVVLSLPLIILFSIGMFAWYCARVVIYWITGNI